MWKAILPSTPELLPAMRQDMNHFTRTETANAPTSNPTPPVLAEIESTHVTDVLLGYILNVNVSERIFITRSGNNREN